MTSTARVRLGVLVLLLAGAATSPSAATAGSPGREGFAGYCLAENRFYDPPDVPEGGSIRGPLPPGFSERDVVVDGVRSPVLDGGPRSRQAVLFVHGNPGSAREWLEVMAEVAAHRRVIAFDLPGWGHADKRRTLPYTLEANTDFAEGVLDRLGVRRAWVGGHDIGASTAIELAVRRPRRTNGVFILNGGILPGYEWHFLAQVWRTPGQGELFWATFTRQSWELGVQQGQRKPLPEEWTDRTYDDLDRFTRCAIMDTYRQVDDPGALGLRQAAAVRRFDIPALVVWGRHDPYVGAEYAEQQRRGFPSARIEIFEESAHWPYVDEPQRVAELIERLVRASGVPRTTARRLRSRRGGVRLPLRCSASGPRCSGRLELVDRRARALGRGRFSIRPGRRRAVHVRLRPAARRRLEARRAINARTRLHLDGHGEPVHGRRLRIRR